MRLTLNVFPLDPDSLLEFISVQYDLCAAVDIAVKSGQKIVHYAPRLGFVITDILNLQPDFFHDFPGNSLLQSLSDFVEPGYQRVKSIAPSGIFCHKDPVPVRNADYHRRKDPGIDRSSTVRTAQRPFCL